MRQPFVSRAVPLIIALAVPLVSAQAQTVSLPSNPPTTSLLPSGTAGPAPSSNSPRPSEVSFAGGQLSISARNASLNQILREVAHLTGMKITGGVAEDRVFGTYGPASTSEVLASLLDGTSSNLLIVDATDGPAQLILTPRRGGPTPPNPNAATNDANYEPPQQPLPPPQQFNPRQGPQTIVTGPPGLGGLPPSNGGQTGTPINGGADLGTTPGSFVPAGQSPPDATAQPGVQSTSPTSTTVDPSQPQSPNGVSTPQQIYEQLMRLRQQQQQQQQTNPQ